MSRKILVVDDEPKIVKVINDFLINEGFQVTIAENGREAMARAAAEKPDLMLLDIMLPEQSGFEVCKQLRQSPYNLPIIMLTARGDEIDKLLGLELGADDYITKPFSLRELAARIRAVLRRTEKISPGSAGMLQAGSLTIDINKYESWIDGVPLALTPTEIKILHLLAASPGQVLSRLQILEHVFGEAYEGYERSIDTHISNIRKKIETDPLQPALIRTVYGVGYKFVEARE
ncbi:MAG: response regulator transcription factor [Syntrophomonas sp.]